MGCAPYVAFGQEHVKGFVGQAKKFPNSKFPLDLMYGPDKMSDMTLKRWRMLRGLTLAEVAKHFNLTDASEALKYESGTRIPRPSRQREIYALSGGMITPADWVGLGDADDDEAA